ncbi:MAG: hypothetical protein K8I29_09395 [Alphaproteobacteria bacterium]|uniref:Cytochrome b/b6 C-terminal region profile domain-containing protein n=1 Tax=Candidatus Nitrobium versatile TaxID=2884831 RepID=A0A953M1C1_9BACT|nr:hypothetical protein [Candidatus Nitrobium versatile]
MPEYPSQEKGGAGGAGGTVSGEMKRFYPEYLAEILVVAYGALGAVLAFALVFAPGIDAGIGSSAAYQPVPEWYFLWFYQMAHHFPGGWTFVGTVLLPFFAFALFTILPALDRGTGRGRALALACYVLLVLAFLVLTLIPFTR